MMKRVIFLHGFFASGECVPAVALSVVSSAKSIATVVSSTCAVVTCDTYHFFAAVGSDGFTLCTGFTNIAMSLYAKTDSS